MLKVGRTRNCFGAGTGLCACAGREKKTPSLVSSQTLERPMAERPNCFLSATQTSKNTLRKNLADEPRQHRFIFTPLWAPVKLSSLNSAERSCRQCAKDTSQCLGTKRKGFSWDSYFLSSSVSSARNPPSSLSFMRLIWRV